MPTSKWKLLGIAGAVGVAATGAAVVRRRRPVVDLPPDELRARLHERLAAAQATGSADPTAPDRPEGPGEPPEGLSRPT